MVLARLVAITGQVPEVIRPFMASKESRSARQGVFRVNSSYQPAGDQPKAIRELVDGLQSGLAHQTLLGVTGSGKTAAFVLPMLTHVMAQPELSKGDGPIALILAPTHELAEQIVKEARRFAKPLGVRCTAVFGGVGKYEQFKELKAGVEVLVATPGRLIELIGTKGALSMARVTYVVIDEADRMFSLGFEQQVP